MRAGAGERTSSRCAAAQGGACADPLGSFVFPKSPREGRFLFIAGGTGIAPLRSMIRHAVLAGARGGSASSTAPARRSDFAYLPELRRWRGGGRSSWRWRRRGRCRRDGAASEAASSPAQLARLVDDPATLCFVCGPAAMVADVPPMLEALGVDETGSGWRTGRARIVIGQDSEGLAMRDRSCQCLS